MNAVQQLLTYVQKSMTVYDRQGAKVGKVNFVYPGVNDDYLTEWNIVPGTSVDEDLLPDEVRDALPEDRVPAEVRERLLQMGFVKINTGLLATDRYALPEQIESVRSDSVYLSVDENDTLKF